jgi:hypothetical protein
MNKSTNENLIYTKNQDQKNNSKSNLISNKNLNKSSGSSDDIYIHKLHPDNVTGYFDGEGCFNVSISKNIKMNSGYAVTFSAEIKQHSDSKNILYSIKEFFNNKGNINYSNETKTVSRYKISNLNDIINLVIPHFDKYPLVTSKHLNFLDFKKAILFLKSGEHLTPEGVIKLREIIRKMNTNRSFLDK